MSSEIQVQCGMKILKGNLSYFNQPSTFIANLNTAAPVGPTPGAVTVSTGGTTVSLTALSAQGGMLRITNTDPTNYVTWGVLAGATFVPVGELLAGETALLRMSRILLYGASGTALVNFLRMIANTASVIVLVDAFDP